MKMSIRNYTRDIDHRLADAALAIVVLGGVAGMLVAISGIV